MPTPEPQPERPVVRYKHSVPCFWPLIAMIELEEAGLDPLDRSLRTMAEVEKVDLHGALPPWATPNRVVLDLHTLRLRDFSDEPAAPNGQVIEQLFKENRLARGRFTGLGRQLSLADVTCPTFLLAGEKDDITPSAQDLLGTPKPQIVSRHVPGGHIGLFMGSRALQEHWPEVARWLCALPGTTDRAKPSYKPR
jgi:pimeloyl-ACP methyl ester carboxylesterase